MKRFSILFCGALVNSVGTGLSAFALAIFMFDAYGTASSVVLVQLSAFAPIVLLAPVAGVLADRFDRRVMMAIGDGGSSDPASGSSAAGSRPPPASRP